jgi:DNA-binding response OmpR family regulator
VRVLVVEDDASILETIGVVLEAYDYEVNLLSRGEDVIDFLKKTWPDVMLLDLTLQGMSGEEVYQKIVSEFGRTPPTVVISAVQQGERRAGRLPGALFLEKPYTLEDLVEVIEKASAARTAA